ncbi:MAG: hypothetical protein RLN89_02720 [Parvibaculum sp.]
MADQLPVSRQPLIVPFDQRSGEMMVYGGGFAALFVLTIALARGELGFYLASLGLALLAFHFLPFVSKKVPALALSSEGIRISGVGVVAWEAIRAAEIINKSVRSIRNAELHLTLTQPLAEATRTPDPGGFGRKLMVQIARVEGSSLIIKLEPLGTSPEVILASVSSFLSQR